MPTRLVTSCLYSVSEAVHLPQIRATCPLTKPPHGVLRQRLGVENETELLAIGARLTMLGVPHVLIREDVGPFGGQATAIGVTPTHDRKTVGKAVSSLRLVR